LSSLLSSTDLANYYEGGSIAIARLAVPDYHRFHSPIGGRVLPETTDLGTDYYSVQSKLIRSRINVLTQNKRLLLLIESAIWGQIALVIVGAVKVGSIRLTVRPGSSVRKGDELGYFAYGGSTVVMLFKRNRVVFDEDLLANSRCAIETLVCMGQTLGQNQRS